MSLKKDKVKVLGERFDDERIKTFLFAEPHGGANSDYCSLERAYRGMVAENFSTFVKFFVAEGLDINATNSDGKTLLQIIGDHNQGQDYINALKAHGAS